MIKGIIIEGTDCSGKSTLVDHLKAELSRSGWDSYDLGHKKGDQFHRYLEVYANADRIVFDRGHFSEVVYGNLWRDGVHFSKWQLDYLNRLAYGEFIVIFVHAPEEVLVDRYKKRHYGQAIDPGELTCIQEAFSILLNDNRVIKYEATSHKELESTVDEVFNRLRAEGLMEAEIKNSESFLPNDDTPQFILLEGVNGSGKSTLAKLLKVNAVGWGVKTLDYTDKPPFQRYLKEYSMGVNQIFDRGHFSEIVYGNLFRAGKHFSDFEKSMLNDLVANKGIVVLCDPPIDIINQRINLKTYPKHIHESRLIQVRQEFIKELSSSGIDYLVVDTSQPESMQDVVGQLAKMIGGIPYSDMGWAEPLAGAEST